MRFLLRPGRAVAVALSAASVACTSPEVSFRPEDPTDARAPIDPAEVEVYSNDAPDWDYTLAGAFQESSDDGIAGGRRGLMTLLRHMGAERGCDAVIVGGRTSRFDGHFGTKLRVDWGWGERPRRSQSAFRIGPLSVAVVEGPIFEELGARAECVVRTVPVSHWRHSDVVSAPSEFYSF